MERLPMETGRAVQSLQGRDAGRCFVILQVVDDQFVLMADGLTRKLDHPKKKKVKHLHPKPVRMKGVEDGLKSHQAPAHGRRSLAAYQPAQGQRPARVPQGARA